MSLAKLNIWVSELDDPCKISNRTWYINIFNCDGTVLKWCDFEYAVIPARCGHRTIYVPPGCYRINAVWSFRIGDGVYYVNHFTDSAIVQACCDNHQCVTLFNPSAHRCGVIFLAAVRDIAQQDALPGEVVENAQGAIRQVLKHIPRPVRPGEIDLLDDFEKRVRAAEERGIDEKEVALPFPPGQ